MNLTTLLIDEYSRDIVFDDKGDVRILHNENVIVQNIRHALLTWKSEFFADVTHGTDYESILGVNQNDIEDDEIKEIIREAVFQEYYVSKIEDIHISYDKRTVDISLKIVLISGARIMLEVRS